MKATVRAEAMTNKSSLRELLHEVLTGEFLKWKLEGVTHVALGCQGFEPITLQQAACRGVRVFNVETEHEAILASMLRRATTAVDDAMDLGMRAALGGAGGRA